MSLSLFELPHGSVGPYHPMQNSVFQKSVFPDMLIIKGRKEGRNKLTTTPQKLNRDATSYLSQTKSIFFYPVNFSPICFSVLIILLK